MSATKLQRWLDLIAFLAARRFPVSAEQIMEGVPAYAAGRSETSGRREASVRRMFERDNAELREAGIPVETVHYEISYGTEQAEGYRLAREDFHIPYVRLLEEYTPEGREPNDTRSGREASGGHDFVVRAEDLTAALEGLSHVRQIPSSPLASGASSALRKLASDLPIGFPSPPAALYLEPPGGPDPRPCLETLSVQMPCSAARPPPCGITASAGQRPQSGRSSPLWPRVPTESLVPDGTGHFKARPPRVSREPDGPRSD